MATSDAPFVMLNEAAIAAAELRRDPYDYAYIDNAIDPEAARSKGIRSAVAGRAQILVVPDLEAGNMLAKNLSFLAGADAAGIVLGARVPIILTSRADSVRTRMASCAIAVLYAHASRSMAAVAAA